MAKFYYLQVKMGKIDLEDVPNDAPKYYRDKVQEMLDND